MEEPFRIAYRVVGILFFLTSISKMNELTIYQQAQAQALQGIQKNTERISVEVSGQLKNIHYQLQRYTDANVKPWHQDNKQKEEQLK